MNLCHHVQDLNDNKKRLFYKRGWLRDKHYRKEFLHWEISTKIKPSIRLWLKDNAIKFSFGFPFSLFLEFPFKFIPKFLQFRNFEIYIYEGDFSLRLFSKREDDFDSEKGGFKIYKNLKEFFLGKSFREETDIVTNYETPRYFFYRGKEYQMDKIVIKRIIIIHNYIPAFIYTKKYNRLEVDIKNPPKRAGKGENSWDCDDDATYGMSCLWKSDIEIKWENRENIFEEAIKQYISSHRRDMKNYGRASGDTLPKDIDDFKYIGLKKEENAR